MAFCWCNSDNSEFFGEGVVEKVVPSKEQRSVGRAKRGDIGVNRKPAGSGGLEPLLMLYEINIMLLNVTLVVSE